MPLHDIVHTCCRHALDMGQTCIRHASDMHQTCIRHASDMRQVPHHRLGSAEAPSADMKLQPRRQDMRIRAALQEEGPSLDITSYYQHLPSKVLRVHDDNLRLRLQLRSRAGREMNGVAIHLCRHIP